MDFNSVMRSLGGIASVGQLQDAGFNAQYVRAIYRRGGIHRVRRGWYALATANADVVAAARVGGTLACVSGAAFYGTWMPPNEHLHVAVPDGSRHLKHPVDGTPVRGGGTGLTVHWNGPVPNNESFWPGVLPLRDCLAEVLRCQVAEMAFAVVESALANRLIGPADVSWLRAQVPSRKYLLRLVGSDAGSGTESLFRYRMARMGIRMRSQIEIGGVGFVDFLIGDRLIVEIDSHQHHGTREQRIRDLNRDAVAQTLDYIPLRFDYVQVLSDWEGVASIVTALVERGKHLNAKSVSRATRRLGHRDAPNVTSDTDFAMEETHFGAAGSL